MLDPTRNPRDSSRGRPLRIALLNHNVAFRGGTFQRAFNFSRELARRGHTPTLFTISPAQRLRFETQYHDGVEIVLTPDLLWGIGRTGWDPWDAFRRSLAARTRNVDVVVAFDSRPAVIFPALWWARSSEAPLVMDWADWWGRGGAIGERPFRTISRLIGPLEGWLEEAFRGRAQQTTVISRALGERAVSLGIDPDTISVIPNGSDTHSIVPMDLEAARSRTGLGEGPMVGVLGTPYPSDLQLLLDAMREAWVRTPELRLLVIGSPTHPNLRPLFETLGDDHRLVAPGFVPDEDLSAWLSACDALLLPMADTTASRRRWPGKVNDYFAAGRPVLATDVSDAGAVIERHAAGVVVEASGEAFGAAIADAVSDQAILAGMGESGRRLAEGELSWMAIGDRMERTLRAALGERV